MLPLSRRGIAALVLLAVPCAAAAAESARATWISRDGHVRIDHRDAIAPSGSTVVGNIFFGRGWRVYWDGPDPSANLGRVIVSFGVKARPSHHDESARELLQIGVSHDRHVVASCLYAGLRHGDGVALPDQTINGLTYAAYSNSDQSMSQGTTTLDLRVVTGGACYAIDRITETAESASDTPGALPQAQAAAELDAMLTTVHITP
jgi:hypothetical protein